MVKMLAKSTVLFWLLFLADATAQTIPTPESVLGHKPGDDFYLANYDESRDYFHKLAAASNRIKLISVGKTTRGLDWEIAISLRRRIWRSSTNIRTLRANWRKGGS